MTYERVQKSFGQSSSKKKHTPIVPPLIEQETPEDSQLSPKVQPSSIPSKEERVAIRRSLFEKWDNASPSSIVDVRTHIQPKLTIGEPGDKYEQEADKVASQVVNQINAPHTQQKSQNLQHEEISSLDELQMKSKADTIESQEILDEEKLRIKSIVQLQPGAGGMTATPDLETSIQQARGGGESLADNIRQPMEQAFGADFSRVKVHTDTRANQLNQSIQARAFTTGQDVFFRQGEYNPGSRSGQELLAHELTHVVQQSEGAVQRLQKVGQELNASEKVEMFQKFPAARRQSALKKIVWEGHIGAIAEICKKHKYTIAIRETGPLSIKRIAEGAKAKPHTILEKSIKESSLKKGYENQQAQEILQKLEKWDLDGFVGHWDRNHKLIGVRIDKIPQDIKTSLEMMRLEEGITEPYLKEEGGIAYVPLDLNQDDGGLAIQALKKIEQWKTYLYTGDYDLHEAYSSKGGGPGPRLIPEATKDKVDLLNELNQGIEEKGTNSKMRGGEASLNKSTQSIHMEGDYAMFQHGDQATYRMNQHLEAKALKEEVAKLVQAVATESDEPIAWCSTKGEWFVTLNKKEHDVFRERFKLKKPHTWSSKEDQRTAEEKKNTERYI